MAKKKEITNEEFRDILDTILLEEGVRQLLTIGGIYEILSEEYNNEVLKRWARIHEEDE